MCFWNLQAGRQLRRCGEQVWRNLSATSLPFSSHPLSVRTASKECHLQSQAHACLLGTTPCPQTPWGHWQNFSFLVFQVLALCLGYSQFSYTWWMVESFQLPQTALGTSRSMLLFWTVYNSTEYLVHEAFVYSYPSLARVISCWD